jgi:type IV secretory pathway VirB3-like protein
VKQDAVFKGCMRPQLLYGAPLGPAVLVAIPILAIGFLGTMLALFVYPPFHWLMVLMIKRDEAFFDLLGLRINAHFKCLTFYRDRFGGTIFNPTLTSAQTRSVNKYVRESRI